LMRNPKHAKRNKVEQNVSKRNRTAIWSVLDIYSDDESPETFIGWILLFCLITANNAKYTIEPTFP
jgi:hypothetical protein